MAKDSLEALFAEVQSESKRRDKMDKWRVKGATVRTLLMPCQVRLEQDPARRVAVRAARRTGKSTGALLVIVIRCLENAGAHWVIVGLTRSSVKRNYWADFQSLNDRYELNIKFQHQELTATFANGSKIYFTGADNASEAEKLRGGKYDGVLIDECKSYPQMMFDELITDIIEPALLDRRGQLIIIGTPGDQLAGPFYLSTTEDPVIIKTSDGNRLSNAPYGSTPEYPANWSLHAWTLRDNTTLFRDKRGNTYTLWDEALEKKRLNGWDDTHPSWRREYLGQWVANNLKYVYRVKPHIHCYQPMADTHLGLPEVLDGRIVKWRTVIGWDLGSKDGTAAVVWAFSDTHPGLWEVYSERIQSTEARAINISFIANWYKDLDARYGPFEGWPADTAGLALMVVDTLASEHGVYLEPAEKTEKNDHIELFNNDLDAGLIHLRADGQLVEEMLLNQWLAKTIGTDRRKEDPATPNDLCDAGLYSFRWARHRQAVQQPSPKAMFTPEWWITQQKLEMEAEMKAARSSTVELLDRDWWK